MRVQSSFECYFDGFIIRCFLCIEATFDNRCDISCRNQTLIARFGAVTNGLEQVDPENNFILPPGKTESEDEKGGV